MIVQSKLPQQRPAFNGGPLSSSTAKPHLHSRLPVVCVRAEQGEISDRRQVLTLLGGVAASLHASPSYAAFGEGANIFGKPTGNTTGLIPYVGKGFKVDIPSKWTPSAERDMPNVVLRYEDTGDSLNSVVIFKSKKGSSNLGDPQSFLKENAYLFGQNAWNGDTISEGGFRKNQVSATSLINSYVDNRDGKSYYKMEVLSRTADGTEGGKHNLIAAATGGGDLWVCKVTIGDKRWMRGAGKFGKSIFDTFTVA